MPEAWIGSWLWLDEGIAVAAEAEAVEAGVIPKNVDWLGFTLDWVDRPDRSLDDPRARYQSALFVRYVKRLMSSRGDATFLNRVWQRAESVWEAPSQRLAALDALEREFGGAKPSLTFCSAETEDVFASGFCFDSYFMNDPQSLAYEPAVFKRFKARAITRSWQVEQGGATLSDPPEQYPLAGLACRYFRFHLRGQPGTLHVRVAAKAGHSLKAELGLVSKKGTRRYGLKQVGTRKSEGECDVLVCELPDFSRKTCDHAVLVVTNCAFSPESPDGPPSGYTQYEKFTVEAEVL